MALKTIKLILATLLMMVAFTVQAQERVVQVYKDGAVVKEYPASEVKDVQVKPVYGYYSFNATTIAEIKNLTESDFTKLAEATSEVDCGVAGVTTVLTTGTTAPDIYWYSIMDGGYGNIITLNRAGTLTVTINDIIYNVWYCTKGLTSASDTSKVKIIIK